MEEFVSLTFFEVLRGHLLREQRRVFSAWYAQQIWAAATDSLSPKERRWHRAPNTHTTGRTLARFQSEGKIIGTDESPSVFILQDASLSTVPPSAYELLSALHPNSVLTYESALLSHELTLRFTNQIRCSWDPTSTFTTSEADARYDTSPPRQRPTTLRGQPISWHRESAERLNYSERLNIQGVRLQVATIERTLVDGLVRPQWCGGPAEVFQAWQTGFDFIEVEAVEKYATLINNKVLYQRTGFILETLGYRSATLDKWARNAKPGGSAVLVPGLPWTKHRDERWKLGINFQHGLSE